MTEESTEIAQPKSPVQSGGALSALAPQNLDDAFRLAKALSMAGDMVPQHFQNKPEATMAAIVRGMEIGLAPMQALSNIAVINGRPSLWGDAIPALMQRAGHQIDVVVEGGGDNMTATATLTRGDTGQVIVRSFSVEDAKKAGLFNKKGPWQQYLKRMLSLRARTLAARDGAADALMGLQIAEEVQDYQPIRDVTPKEGGFADMATKARSIEPEANDTEKDVSPPSEPENEPDSIPDAEVVGEFDEDAVDPFAGAYDEGVKASKAAMTADMNPHDAGTPGWNNWLGGWNFMEQQKDEVDE